MTLADIYLFNYGSISQTRAATAPSARRPIGLCRTMLTRAQLTCVHSLIIHGVEYWMITTPDPPFLPGSVTPRSLAPQPPPVLAIPAVPE